MKVIIILEGMFLSVRPLVRLGAAAVLLLSAQGRTLQPGMSEMNPAAGVVVGGVEPVLQAEEDWHPLGPTEPLDVQTSVTSVDHYPGVDSPPEGGEYIPTSGLLLLMNLCR